MRANTTPLPSTQSVTTTKKRQPTWMKTLEPDAKRPTRIPRPQQVKLPDEIGKYVVRNAEEVNRIGWTEVVRWQRGHGDFDSLSEVDHPEQRLLRQDKHPGAPVVLPTDKWTEGGRLAALARGTHQSATE